MFQSPLPSLKQLRYLVALRHYGHFGRAAEACFVTQSTLSSGLRELEKLFGVSLVERTRRVVRFTPLGEKIAARAQNLLGGAEALFDAVRMESAPLSGQLRLGVIPTIAPFLLPYALPLLRESYKNLDLFLREETSGAACASLARGELDCVLLALPYECGDVAHVSLFKDPLWITCHEARQGELVSTDDFDGSRLLLLEDGHCLRDHALTACARADIGTQTMMVGASLHTLVQMVNNDLGIAVVPEMAIRGGILNNCQIHARPLQGPNVSRDIVLAWRASNPRVKEFHLLADALRQAGLAALRSPIPARQTP